MGGKPTSFQVKNVLTQSRGQKKKVILLKLICIDTNQFKNKKLKGTILKAPALPLLSWACDSAQGTSSCLQSNGNIYVLGLLQMPSRENRCKFKCLAHLSCLSIDLPRALGS